MTTIKKINAGLYEIDHNGQKGQIELLDFMQPAAQRWHVMIEAGAWKINQRFHYKRDCIDLLTRTFAEPVLPNNPKKNAMRKPKDFTSDIFPTTEVDFTGQPKLTEDGHEQFINSITFMRQGIEIIKKADPIDPSTMLWEFALLLKEIVSQEVKEKAQRAVDSVRI